ncbi:DNA-directed RNA polymerase subunit E'' [Candidatus Woesearchaeota archaeon]|nr:DNA-directed RNA polymerase subunit E'' [Candidatus Woesearchaeota archaeon]
MKRKICRNCKLFVEESECPVCKGNQFNNTWQGRINIIDSKHSVVGKKMGISANGEYAIKTR